MMSAEFEAFMRESNAIEGEFDAAHISEEIWPDGAHKMTGFRLRGCLHPRDLEAMEFMYRFAYEGQKPTEEKLLFIHGILSEHRDMEYKGMYRKCEVMIGNRRGIAHKDVPHKMRDLFTFWDMQSAWRLHAMFEVIHPFEDLNGRTGRILWAWKMLQIGSNPFKMPFLQAYYYQTLSNFSATL